MILKVRVPATCNVYFFSIVLLITSAFNTDLLQETISVRKQKKNIIQFCLKSSSRQSENYFFFFQEIFAAGQKSASLFNSLPLEFYMICCSQIQQACHGSSEKKRSFLSYHAMLWNFKGWGSESANP